MKKSQVFIAVLAIVYLQCNLSSAEVTNFKEKFGQTVNQIIQLYSDETLRLQLAQNVSALTLNTLLGFTEIVTHLENRLAYQAAVIEKLTADVRKMKTVVHFESHLSTFYNTTGTVIPFDQCTVNIGSAMDCTTGIFTAPISGVYQFHLSLHSLNGESLVALHRPGSNHYVTPAKGDRDQTNKKVSYASMSHTFVLNSSDQVCVYLYNGQMSGVADDCSTSGNCSIQTTFTGSLVKPIF